MSTRQLQTLLEGGAFFECPRWYEGEWWLSDFYRHVVVRVGADGVEHQVLEVEGQPGGLGWMPDGSLLVVSMRDQRILRWSAERGVSEHADVSAFCGGHLNDMVVDARGGAYVGNFGFDLMGGGEPAAAGLARVEADGRVSLAAGGLLFPNGAVITPDGATLIVGETIGARYTSFAIGADGSLSDRRVWAQLAPTPELTTFEQTLAAIVVGPDGCGLDAAGHIWAADEANARCIRIAAGGEIVDEIPMPDGLSTFACMLGGDDGRTLLICAAPDFVEANRFNARESILLTTTVEVPHAGLP